MVDRIHECGRARVPRADLELEAGRRPEGPALDLCGLSLVCRPQPPCGQLGGPGGGGAAAGERQRGAALSRASAPVGCGGARGDPPGEVHPPVGGVVCLSTRSSTATSISQKRFVSSVAPSTSRRGCKGSAAVVTRRVRFSQGGCLLGYWAKTAARHQLDSLLRASSSTPRGSMP